jgi:hypothetical protein
MAGDVRGRRIQGKTMDEVDPCSIGKYGETALNN